MRRPGAGRKGTRLGRLFRFSPLAVLGVAIFLAWVVVALVAPWIAPYDPRAQNVDLRFSPPGSTYLLGSDNLGRDILSRVVYGARVSLPAGIVVVVLAAAVGILVGSLAGFLGGWADEALMRMAEIIMAFPPIILAMAVAAALGRSFLNAVVAIVLVWWPSYARMTRGLVISAKENEYVQAARAFGASPARVLFRTVLPNCLGPVLVMASVDLGNATLTFSGLSFLGLGVVPPTPEWGAMVATGSAAFTYWWVSVFPGLAILSLAMGFNFIGDAVRDFMEPRLRRQL